MRPMRLLALANVVLSVLLAALLAGLMLALGSPTPALAHAGHDHAHKHPSHRPATSVGATSAAATPARAIPGTPAAAMAAPPGIPGLVARPVEPGQQLVPTRGRLPLTDGSAAKAHEAPVEPLHQDTCCCGSLACHAGVMAVYVTIADPYRLGERWRPRPVIAFVRAALDGIERPPRAPLAA